jgi:hypothetical protein
MRVAPKSEPDGAALRADASTLEGAKEEDFRMYCIMGCSKLSKVSISTVGSFGAKISAAQQIGLVGSEVVFFSQSKRLVNSIEF